MPENKVLSQKSSRPVEPQGSVLGLQTPVLSCQDHDLRDFQGRKAQSFTEPGVKVGIGHF